MPPIWPFNKKKETEQEIDEAPPAPVVYKRGEDPNARAAVETDAGAYKDALALFGGGSSAVTAATDQSVHYDGVTSSNDRFARARASNDAARRLDLSSRASLRTASQREALPQT